MEGYHDFFCADLLFGRVEYNPVQPVLFPVGRFQRRRFYLKIRKRTKGSDFTVYKSL